MFLAQDLCHLSKMCEKIIRIATNIFGHLNMEFRNYKKKKKMITCIYFQMSLLNIRSVHYSKVSIKV